MTIEKWDSSHQSDQHEAELHPLADLVVSYSGYPNNWMVYNGKIRTLNG